MKIQSLNLNIPKIKTIKPFNTAKALNFGAKKLKYDSFEKRTLAQKTDNKILAKSFIDSYAKKTLDYDGNLIEDSLNEDFYSVPVAFALMVHNTLLQKGDAHIVDEIPEIFKGLDIDKVLKSIDTLAESLPIEDGKIKIAEKTFDIEYIDEGKYGKVYLISDSEKGNKIALKIFKKKVYDSSFKSHGALNEIPILRQLTKDKVVNVPKFYMARANCYDLKQRFSLSPWMVEEYITYKTKPKEGKYLREWLCENDTIHADLLGNSIGSYVVDIGGIKTLQNFADPGFLFAFIPLIPRFSHYVAY